jgi:hypothetical protein
VHENGQKTSECIEDVCVNIDKRIRIFTELHMQNTILKIQMLTKFLKLISIVGIGFILNIEKLVTLCPFEINLLTKISELF